MRTAWLACKCSLNECTSLSQLWEEDPKSIEAFAEKNLIGCDLSSSHRSDQPEGSVFLQLNFHARLGNDPHSHIPLLLGANVAPGT